MEWFYAEDGKQVGPVSDAALADLVKAGRVTSETLVWHQGLANWTPYGEVKPEAGGAHSASPGTGKCAECGRSFWLADMVTYQGVTVCAACKPTFFQRIQEGAAVPGTLEYAGFWTRFLAKFIDGIVMGAVNMVVSLIGAAVFGVAMAGAAAQGSVAAALGLQLGLWLIQMTLSGVYYVLFLGRFGATPGKMALRIKVVRSDGSPVTYGRAFGRYFADMLSGLTLGIGYIMAAFDEEKRALHDRLCDTRVIRRPA